MIIATISNPTAAQYQRKSGGGPCDMAEVCRLNITDANKIDPAIAIIMPIKLPGNPRLAVPAIIQMEAKKATMRTYQIITQNDLYQTAQHCARRTATP
jgi:hypothetical protein